MGPMKGAGGLEKAVAVGYYQCRHVGIIRFRRWVGRDWRDVVLDAIVSAYLYQS